MTLKNGFILFTALNLILGVSSFIFLILFASNFFSSDDEEIYNYAQIIEYIVSSIGIYFSFLGLRGIFKMNVDDIELFYKFKLVELLTDFALELIIVSSGKEKIVSMIISIMISTLITKAVWSTFIRLQNNETVLVIHGEKVLFLMQQQAVNQSIPKAASPGPALYFSYPPKST